MRSSNAGRLTGVLFLTATLSGILGSILLGPLDDLTTATEVAGQADRLTTGALFILVMIAAITLIPVAVFPVLRTQGEPVALGYLATRLLEAILLLPAALGPLALIALARSGSDTARPDIRSYAQWGLPASQFFFCGSVIILNVVLYRSVLLPRWIPAWALAAVVPYLADAFLITYDQTTASSTLHNLLLAPLALNELVLAIRLIATGFRYLPAAASSADYPERNIASR